MRLPEAAHTSRPWRIHELTRDFRVEDVWALPTPGGVEEFPRLVRAFTRGESAGGSGAVVRALFAIRWKLGRLLGWDDPDDGVGSRVESLRERLPADMREVEAGGELSVVPFNRLYVTDEEWAGEIANGTMHGVLHLGWVPEGGGRYHGQMAVLVKPNGLSGRLYMAAIRPFRHLVVYPSMIRRIERRWDDREGESVNKVTREVGM